MMLSGHIELRFIFCSQLQGGFERRPVNFHVHGGPGKLQRRLAVLTTSVSAQDFWYFDMEREKNDCSTPRGPLGDCIGRSSEEHSSGRGGKETMVKCTNTQALSQWRKCFSLWKGKSVRRLSSFPPLGVPRLSKKKTRNSGDGMNPALSDIYNLKSQLVHFALSKLEMATKNFNKDNLIGHGAFVEVYKGRLKSGQLVAVKWLTKGTADEKIAVFLSKLEVIAHLNHPNIAKLVGCCVEGGLHLVLQLSSHICDFGLAKWLPTQWTHSNVTKFEGTFGYFATEYFMHGIVDEKTDIYAFGVLLLELLTGRNAVDKESKSLVLWAKPLLDNDNVTKLVDPSLSDNYNSEEMDRVIMTSSLRIEQSPVLRPRMNQTRTGFKEVARFTDNRYGWKMACYQLILLNFTRTQVAVLIRGEKFISEFTEDCLRRPLRRTYSEELSDALEYNSTKYLSDLKRQKEVALGS